MYGGPRQRQTRFVTSQIVEDTFNRVKKGVDLGSNTKCSAPRAWALPIDKSVVSQIHRYTEVDRHEVQYSRMAEIDDRTFQPPLKLSKQSEGLRDLQVNKVAGYGDATWYSPQAQSCMRPVCEMLAARVARATNNFELLEKSWLCRLISKRMLFRKFGTADWFIGIGDICSTLACGWPTVKATGIEHTYQPAVRDGDRANNFAIMNVDEWEAMPIVIHSSLHQDVLASVGGSTGKEVQVKPSREFVAW